MPATSYRYLTNVPGVRSGRTIIGGTRIGVHDVVGLLQNGETMETLIARCFPDLTRAQVYECLAYYEDHRGEIDLLVAQQEQRESPTTTNQEDQPHPELNIVVWDGRRMPKRQ